MDAFLSVDKFDDAWEKRRDERRASHVTLERLIRKIKPSTSQNTTGSLSTTQDEPKSKSKTDEMRNSSTCRSRSVTERHNGQVPNKNNAHSNIQKPVPNHHILGQCRKQRKACACLRHSPKNLHQFLLACAAQRSKRTERRL